ncbi:flagellar export protein FliJ [Horticoccus sp. 23ND18S-11]|uniref:hypothetical protein n=1 Tax=Horticoccus sp. 23ND18S-11 TaxID=3391832 RepID=UPI0039C91034
MKRFRFSLQAVAVLRAHHELKAREAFAAAVQAHRQTDEALALVRARVTAFEVALAARRQQRFSAADEAQTLGAYRQECSAEAEAEKVMHAARAVMQQRRADYLDAHRKVEVVKRLEVKARTRHRLAGLREEQAIFDDTAGYRFVTRRAALSV